MIDTNELRRLAQAATPGPDGISLSWITLLQDFQQGVSPAVIIELLDRLEEAESDALEQARLNGMGASREAALMAKLEAAEKEVAHIKEVEFPRKVRAVAVGWETKCARLEQERDALSAKIEAMERQKPVTAQQRFQRQQEMMAVWHPWQTTELREGRPARTVDVLGLNVEYRELYLAPGAQPAPSVPEGWKLVPIEPTHEMLDAGEDTFVPTYTGTPTSAPIDVYRAMLAAAPEAKP